MQQIIVSVTNEKRSFEYDIEIPVDLEGEKLLDDIVESLNGYNPSLFLKKYGMALRCIRTNRLLKENETPEQSGIRNGDYLLLEKMEGRYGKDTTN